MFPTVSIHEDKDRHLLRASAALWLDQVPDIIRFRDCTLLSLSNAGFSCFRFSWGCRFGSDGILISMLSCGFPVYRGGHFLSIRVPEPCGSVGVACQNKRVAKGHSRRSGKISTLRVVFFRLAVNIPSFEPHAFQVSSNSNNHTVFGRMRLKKSPHRYESHKTTYK